MATNTPAPASTPPLLVDRREAARLLGICPNSVTNLQRRGELIPVRIGARVLFDMEDLLRYVQSRKGAAR